MSNYVEKEQDILAHLLGDFDQEDSKVVVPFMPGMEKKLEAKPGDPKAEFLKELRSYVGISEHGGDNKGKEVEMFQKAVDGKAQSEPWCMAAIQHAIKKVEEKLGIKSKIHKSEHCMTVWNLTPKECRLEKPEPGCIVIWQFGATDKGHTGGVESIKKNGRLQTLEGNTGPSNGEVEREGDGFYEKDRSATGTPKMKIKGFLKVF